MINFLVVTHGEFGAYLVEAAEAIVGVQSEGVRTFAISPRHSVEEIRAKISEDIRELCGTEGLIVVADMPGGTPANVSFPLCKDSSKIRVVSGLNLYMLVSAFSHREGMSVEALAARMVEDGKKSIQDLKELLSSRKGGKPAGTGGR